MIVLKTAEELLHHKDSLLRFKESACSLEAITPRMQRRKKNQLHSPIAEDCL